MYKKTVLDNGLRVATYPMKQRDSVGMGFLVGAGGRYEEDRIKGAAHFLEHILFKGSRKYSCNKIKEQIEGVGGSLNAFTSEEITCYYAKVPSKFLAKTCDVLADMVFHPLITRRDVRKESTVIAEEIKMYYDLPQFYVMELLDGLMWPGHPLGKNLAGSQETVLGMTNKDLREFHRQHYSSGNIVAVATGDLKHEDFLKTIKGRLKKEPSGAAQKFLKAPHSQTTPKFKMAHRMIEQMHLALGMFGLSADHEDKYVLALLNIILGGNMSSRLFNEVREKRGLAYSISSSVKSLRDTGMLMVRAGVDNTKIVEAVEVILKEFKKVKRKGVTNDEFKRAKDFLLGQVLLSLEDTLEHMLWLGEGVVTRNKVRTLQEVVTKVNAIKKNDVQRVAKDILKEKHLNLSIVGPMGSKQERSLRNLIGCR